MSCRDKALLLDAYVDRELELAETLALEEHLQSCASCRMALARLNSLRSALRGRLETGAAPASLRERLESRFAAPAPRGMSWRWGFAFAAPGIAALALALWLALGGLSPSSGETRVVVHISSSATARAALRTLNNHLNASPEAKVVVVAHNEGVDFLLRGARDESGEPFEPDVGRFFRRGVEFRVCYNTLERRQIEASEIIPGATLVPSGIAEISRLQGKEGYAYMRL